MTPKGKKHQRALSAAYRWLKDGDYLLHMAEEALEDDDGGQLRHLLDDVGCLRINLAETLLDVRRLLRVDEKGAS